jgi:hypothetical protein
MKHLLSALRAIFLLPATYVDWARNAIRSGMPASQKATVRPVAKRRRSLAMRRAMAATPSVNKGRLQPALMIRQTQPGDGALRSRPC